MFNKIRDFWTRARRSAVVWSWGFNGLRLASGLLLLPLLLRHLEKTEFAMYYVFLSVIGLLPFLDMGLSWSLGRFVSYAAAGATHLKPQGLPEIPAGSREPNYNLLWQLLRGISAVYKYLAVGGFFVIGLWGTLLVYAKAGETPNPLSTWLAWWLTLAVSLFELYTAWWNGYLIGLNQVEQSARISCLGYFIRLSISCVLLISGAGLLSIPAGALFGTVFARALIRKHVLAYLGTPEVNQQQLGTRSLLRILWPNSWRLALQLLSNYFRTQASIPICLALFGLSATADFGLSLQVFTIASGMAMVWTGVKWPRVAQLRSLNDNLGIRKLLWPRIWLQILTFIVLGALAITIGPWLLDALGTDKRLLKPSLLLVMAAAFLVDMHFSFWGSLLSSENRVPTLWSTAITNLAAVLLALWGGMFTRMGVSALVISPLVCGLAFVYWYWPRQGSLSLGASWRDFMFERPKRDPS